MRQISLPPLCRKFPRLFAILMLLVIGMTRANAQLTINTNTLTINGSGTTFNGFPMTAQNVNGIARFIILGNIDIPDNTTVTIIGDRPLSLTATNNVTIGSGVIFDVSGNGLTALAGGGAGAAGAGGGQGGIPNSNAHGASGVG